MPDVTGLALVQQRVLDRIGAGEGVVEPGDAGGDLGGLITGDERLGAAGRLDVYARMYAARLTDALAALHPTVAGVLGPEALPGFARSYFAAHPSRDPSLRHAGADLVAFLAKEPWTRQRPWLADLARLDQARLDVFDAADAPPLTSAALRAIAPPQLPELVLHLAPAHRLLAVDHAVDDVFRAIELGQPIAPPAAGRRTLLVWRKGVAVLHRAIAADEAAALALAADGVALGVLCERLCQRVGEEHAAATALALLSQWTADELLTAC